MRICLFSDIHGNGPAFRVAYNMIISEKADINIFLGDLCGYYYDQQEIFEMLQTIPSLIALKGNHDVVFLKVVGGDEGLRKKYLEKYGSSMENLLRENNNDIIQWLSGLPESYFSSDLNLAGYHGSPWNYLDEYVYPTESVDRFKRLTYEFVLLGHTHYPMHKTINGIHIINPGSCGQPRDCNKPVYAVLDLKTQEVVFKKIDYNVDPLIKDVMKHAEENKYLADVLSKEC